MGLFESALQVLALQGPAVVGVAGVCLYVGNYCLLVLQRTDSRCIGYFLVNMAAAACVLVSLTRDFNLASAMIQVLWIALGTVGIALRLARRKRGQAAAGAVPALPRDARRRAPPARGAMRRTPGRVRVQGLGR
ncbi:hypothetical protein PSA7680_01642 [Pseudoruegeria aquimaris]|uniref:CBU-0592-like domain-containing protein n=1 Tax=Pseudoruegeria aquimaris TaxID=393663 RepID=A0A1Y5S8E7_9RHOB|nr:hypothetical protein [Pseudoruegeria aquimaris]SLN34835.1 hypothetical protein PSA7680_01642 [Pseudoruegeria aquimaris]